MESESDKQRQPTAIPWAAIVGLGVALIAILALATVIVLGPEDLNADKK